MKLSRLSLLASAFALATFAFIPAHADDIAWTSWSSGTSGSPGSATGTLTSSLYGTITVSYSGQTSGLLTDYPSWKPTSTFTGGVVGNAPPASDNAVGIEGGVAYTETITFSTPVADPIFAVWSLGAPGTSASFDFSSGEPFTVQGGGGSAEYGGTALYISGEDVEGNEGNGIIQFDGTFSSITFTTPEHENYYAFTIGEDDTLTSNPTGPGVTPEPGTLSLLGLGLLALPFARSRFARA